MRIPTILDKILIYANMTLITGMHIGASNDFAPIGAVDSVVVRDPITKKPIIPGSSLKGKLRTLLAKTETDKPWLKKVNEDSIEICRLFGASEFRKANQADKEIIQSRLQFYDLFLSNESVNQLEKKTDLYLTEIKFENTINRLDAVANPRQIERVPAGAKFRLNLAYNVENVEGENKEIDTALIKKQVEEDFDKLALAFKLLQMDYIGGHGSRGYGKVNVSDFDVIRKNIKSNPLPFDISVLINKLKEAENFAPLSV